MKIPNLLKGEKDEPSSKNNRCPDRWRRRFFAFVIYLLLLTTLGGIQQGTLGIERVEPQAEPVEAREPEPTPTPRLVKSEKEQIEEFGLSLFGEDWSLFKKIIQCESSFNPKADNGHDSGLAQVNEVHQIRKDWLKDWRINLTVAYKLFREQGTTPWNASKHCWAN